MVAVEPQLRPLAIPSPGGKSVEALIGVETIGRGTVVVYLVDGNRVWTGVCAPVTRSGIDPTVLQTLIHSCGRVLSHEPMSREQAATVAAASNQSTLRQDELTNWLGCSRIQVDAAILSADEPGVDAMFSSGGVLELPGSLPEPRSQQEPQSAFKQKNSSSMPSGKEFGV